MARTSGSNKVSNDAKFAIFWKEHGFAILEKLKDKFSGYEEKLRVMINFKQNILLQQC